MQKKIKALALILALFASTPGLRASAKKRAAGEETTGTIVSVLWRYPGDIGSRNLFYGPGGKDHEPRGPFTFEKEKLEHHNPKFVVRDRDGVKWTVKLGVEARPETAATRLIWAAGYFADEDYFVRELRVANLPPRLHRGQEFIDPDGTIRNVRLERSEKKFDKAGIWSWKDSPFTGTRELNGLRVMMALINNWDLNDDNNAVYERKSKSAHGIERVYAVSDLGSSFGTTGCSITDEMSKDNLEAYSRSKFITKIAQEYVDFATPSRANLLMIYQLPFFIHSIQKRWIGRGIPRADAKWIGQVLERIAPAQIRDAFRASGYSPEEIEAFAGIITRRIAALNDL